MYSYNISFVCDPALEPRVLRTIRDTFAGATPRPSRLMKVCDAPGSPDFAEQAVTLSLQIDFRHLDEARAYGEGRLPERLERIHSLYANQVMVFATILRQLPLDEED